MAKGKLVRNITQSTIDKTLTGDDSRKLLVENLKNEAQNTTKMGEKSKELLDKINNDQLDVSPVSVIFYENQDTDKSIMGIRFAAEQFQEGQSLEDYNALAAIMAEKNLNGTLQLTDKVTRSDNDGFGLSGDNISKKSTVSAVAFENPKSGENEAHLFAVTDTDVNPSEQAQQASGKKKKQGKGQSKVEQVQ